MATVCKLLVLALVAVVPLVSMAEELNYEKLRNMEDTWANWKKQHGKSYSPREENYRRIVFFKRLISIYEHNSKYPVEVSYTKGLNQFSDMTVEEYKAYNQLQAPAKTSFQSCIPAFLPSLTYKIPHTVDWRKKGYVTPVKDQGACGVGWAFSVTGSVEGQHFRKTGKLLSLSEQQLVDCVSIPNGCMSLQMDEAFVYLLKQPNGLETEAEYPYEGGEDTCRQHADQEKAPIHACWDLPTFNETSLQQAVATVGPVSVAIDASLDSFQDYNGGVYSDILCSREIINHGMLVVGYGTSDGQDYWLVKNSWGKEWGMNGYAKIGRNMGNMCGIATLASYPTV